ncbi:MAG TPA: GNAT family N-acetyltransferase [Eubacteriales bacterium]|nr:GNAT family N-acetyltransferase [Eubacteriales bacterium]
MITSEVFDALQKRSADFRYTSFTYLDYDSVAEYEILADRDDLILLAGWKREAGVYDVQWAANEKDAVVAAAKNSRRETLVMFVPAAWKQDFMDEGFEEFGVLREYWLNDLSKAAAPQIACEPIAEEECAEAAAVTQDCRMQSREFYGESEESLQEWLREETEDLRHKAILACREGGRMAGIALTAVYGFTSGKSPVAWVREVAVRPEYRKKGYGRALVESVVQYGLARGAGCSFLMADDCNTGAVALYRQIGFEPNEEDPQIDLLYRPQ